MRDEWKLEWINKKKVKRKKKKCECINSIIIIININIIENVECFRRPHRNVMLGLGHSSNFFSSCFSNQFYLTFTPNLRIIIIIIISLTHFPYPLIKTKQRKRKRKRNSSTHFHFSIYYFLHQIPTKTSYIYILTFIN